MRYFMSTLNTASKSYVIYLESSSGRIWFQRSHRKSLGCGPTRRPEVPRARDVLAITVQLLMAVFTTEIGVLNRKRG